MLDAENPTQDQPAENTSAATASTDTAAAQAPAKKATAKRAAAKKAAPAAAKKAAVKKATTKKTATKAAAGTAAKKTTAKKTAAKKGVAKRATGKKGAAASLDGATTDAATGSAETAATPSLEATGEPAPALKAAAAPPPATTLLFQAPDPSRAQPRRKRAEPQPEVDAPQDSKDSADDGVPAATTRRSRRRPATKVDQVEADDKDTGSTQADESQDQDRDSDDDSDGEQGSNRRRRRRGGRRRRKSGENDSDNDADDQEASADDSSNRGGDSDSSDGESPTSRRRRRRRRTGEDGDGAADDPENTVTRVRKQRSAEDEITAVAGSTRLEAKKQRRREGREAGRRRAPIASEAEFLARREAVERVMVIRQKKDLTQIAVLEDKVLVEHYVARESQTSLIGNVYLGRVQNVLPSMEAAFIDIGKGRNAVLYAGEVNWGSLGAKGGGQRRIEQVLKSGQSVLVQVSKDPIGHKGARLTSQISLPGRFLVYVPDGTTSGISRKLPDTERNRLKTLLKEIVPDSAGVIVRTAAEGASEDELTRDVERLTARWADIEGKVSGGTAPQLLYGEPDLTLKVVRDLFTEDFGKLVVSGGDAWDMVDEYVKHVAPDLEERLEKYDGGQDVFAAYRIDEQIAKGLDRKVWLPSGGSLIIDRTEAMTVVDVNTGKFTGSGGNLEETVTKNNLEAAEEFVRQLRLRDIGGIIVVDFIDMVLESNRDLVLRRMVECLGRDRTRHQVAEVTSLGLVQMTRKRIGTGLLEAFSEGCEHCQSRGLIVHLEPLETKRKSDDEPRRGRRSGRNRGRDDDGDRGNGSQPVPSPMDVAAMAKADPQANGKPDEPKVHAEAPGSSDAAAPDTAAPDTVAGTLAGADGATVEAATAADQPPVKRPARSSRGGKARRAAGPAITDKDDSQPVDVTADTAASDTETDKPVAEESVDTGAGAPDASAPQPEPEAPKIVTSVRRRGAARRAAGPPPGAVVAVEAVVDPSQIGTSNGVGAADSAPGQGAGQTDAAELPLDVPESPAAAHVPVKRKGTRKR